MGFFSQDCKACGHPALSTMATNERNRWMNEVVVIKANGSLHAGSYDGYGRVDGGEHVIGEDATVWHRACWEVAGRPLDYQGASPYSDDQGWFFDEGDHDMDDPREDE
jgi:hypothetical protein